jgi:hypothetical protein
MATCEVCGNDYDKAFSITQAAGTTATFDSFERYSPGRTSLSPLRLRDHRARGGSRRPDVLLCPLRPPRHRLGLVSPD